MPYGIYLTWSLFTSAFVFSIYSPGRLWTSSANVFELGTETWKKIYCSRAANALVCSPGRMLAAWPFLNVKQLCSPSCRSRRSERKPTKNKPASAPESCAWEKQAGFGSIRDEAHKRTAGVVRACKTDYETTWDFSAQIRQSGLVNRTLQFSRDRNLWKPLMSFRRVRH
jgi:hypothetical protein